MIRLLLVPSSDYLGHPFPQRHNQIFERLHDRKNFEVHVARFKLFEKPNLDSNLFVHELDGRRISNAAPYYLANAVGHASQIRRIVREEGIDVLVLSNLAAPFVYTLMDEMSSLHVPVVFDLPDYYPTSAAGYMFDVRKSSGKLLSGLFDFILQRIVRHASTVTVASHALAGYAKRMGARAFTYIPNGIGECFLELHDKNALREKFGYSEKDLIVGYVGSLEFWLDLRSLIRGIALAGKRGLSLRLLMVGGKLHTSYSERVAQWLRQEGVERCADFIDFVSYDDVPEYMAGIDVGTIPFDISNPTAYYAAPNKMWEYLSQRTPVISTPIPEVLRDANCVLTALTPEDYARVLLLMAKEGSKMRERTEIGHRKALLRTWTNSAELFASAIYSLLDQAHDEVS